MEIKEHFSTFILVIMLGNSGVALYRNDAQGFWLE